MAFFLPKRLRALCIWLQSFLCKRVKGREKRRGGGCACVPCARAKADSLHSSLGSSLYGKRADSTTAPFPMKDDFPLEDDEDAVHRDSPIIRADAQVHIVGGNASSPSKRRSKTAEALEKEKKRRQGEEGDALALIEAGNNAYP